MRTWSLEMESVLRAGAPATRHCMHAPKTLKPALRAQWKLVQEAGARIFHARNNDKKPQAKQAQPRALDAPDLKVPSQSFKVTQCTWQPFRFTVVYSLRRPECRWNYPRSEWHRLTRFLAVLGVWDTLPDASDGPQSAICSLASSV